MEKTRRYKVKDILILLLLFLLGNGCKTHESFTRDAWQEKNDVTYLKRKKIVKDLIENHLNDAVCLDSIEFLLGSPDKLEIGTRQSCIYYEIETSYGTNIDPDYTKFLEIEMKDDSCFHNAKVIKN